MCQFFSFLDTGRRFLYFDWEARKELLKANPRELLSDSHASIATIHGVKEEHCDKYEFNPLTGTVKLDYPNGKSGICYREGAAIAWARGLDMRTVCAPLVVKRIVHPFQVFRAEPRPTRREIAALHRWASVEASMEASVGDSVWASVGDSVWASVRASAGASVWASVGDSVRAYIGTFFSFPRRAWRGAEGVGGRGYPFALAVSLWEAGLVPSFDGKVWRLHAGPKADVVYTWTPK